MFGFINIYKPVGMTSHDVISYLRHITKIKQIGHKGTLDPFAEGILPVAIGKATKLIDYLNDDKAYIGRFNFGKSTDTYDIDGEIVQQYSEKITQKDIIYNLPQFEGEIEQIPPIYSAKKINGKKLYELARKGIENVDIKPCKVIIYKIELLKFNQEEQWADIYIKCSKGTYIRSIANDLGKALKNGCFLSKLKRVQSVFDIENSIPLYDLKTIQDIEKILLNPLDYLSQPKQELNEVEYKRISHGMVIYNRINIEINSIVLLVKDNELVAVAQATSDGLKPKKVFI